MNPIDELAQIIRTVDGKHDLSAAALAERLIEAGVTPPGVKVATGKVWALDSLGSDDDVEGAWYFNSQGNAVASIPAFIISNGGVEDVIQDDTDPEVYIATVRLPDPPIEMVEHFRTKGYSHDGRGGVLRYRFRVYTTSFPLLHTAALSATEGSA